MNILPFDELNAFKEQLPEHFNEEGRIKSAQDYEDIIDELLDLFLLAYANGAEAANASLSSEYVPALDDVMRTVDEKIAGKTWRERVREYFEKGDTAEQKEASESTPGKENKPDGSGSAQASNKVNLKDAIRRIAETEAHRIANAGAFETAKAAGATEKQWHCMMLPTSRDTHVYLDGVKAPIDGEFYSFAGGSTKYPGQWGIAEEDVNCLCWLTFK